jgi:hypothetical protein
MLQSLRSSRPWLLAGLAWGMTTPAMAQVLTVVPQSIPFPVLVNADFKIDPHAFASQELFSVTDGGLNLRSTPIGTVDMYPYCELPDRHWGPVSVVNCFLEIDGAPVLRGPAMPAHIALASMPMGSTVTLRFLVQAPIVVVDLQGNPTAVMDTFLEEYHWTLAGSSAPTPHLSIRAHSS